MGAVFQGPDAPPRARYTPRLRRALPALAFLLVLCGLAGLTWLKVIDQVDERAAAAACGPDPVDSSKVEVRVYNATAREGLARKIAGQLIGRGYAIVATDNDPLSGIRPVDGAAEVRYGPDGARAAALLRRQVPGATLYKDARQGSIIDLVLGDQFRRLSTPAELARGRQGLLAPAATPPAAAASAAASGKKPATKPATKPAAAPSRSPGC
jgi:LytR cell envelope-related transcriptional attenuator